MLNYLGEIRLFGGDFAPAGWMLCEGQLLAISENDSLFSLLGATFGGDGVETFALPDLRGRVPIHAGTGSTNTAYALGAASGAEAVALTVEQLPAHRHSVFACTQPADRTHPAVAAWAAALKLLPYADTASATMSPSAIAAAGDGVPHDNMQPYLPISFIIAMQGVSPHGSLPPMLGEIRLFPYSLVPAKWLPCDGQILALQDYPDLLAVIGTYYGGDGFRTLALPDLRGRAPLHADASHPLGWRGGEETHTLTLDQMGGHGHLAVASAGAATSGQPAGRVWAASPEFAYRSGPLDQNMAEQALDSVGGGLSHTNMQPYLALNHCIGAGGETDEEVQAFLGEIRQFAGYKAPDGWLFCNGQTLKVVENTALFSVLGTYYGGDGKETFALPDLRGAVAIHHGQGGGLTPRSLGQRGGAVATFLTEKFLPAHTHAARCGALAEQASPAGRVWSATVGGRVGGTPLYADTADAPMAPGLVVTAGGSQPHNNMQPSLALNFIIAIRGIYPNRG